MGDIETFEMRLIPENNRILNGLSSWTLKSLKMNVQFIEREDSSHIKTSNKNWKK